MKTVIGIFENHEDATDAIDALKDEGYNAQDLSIVVKDKKQGDEIARDTGVATGNAASGIATGAIIGGLAGLLVSVAIPGAGIFFIGGPIATALGLGGAAAATASGVVTGAVAGGIIGALMGMGVSKEDAGVYEERINSGAILVAVPARRGEEADVEDILKEYNASDIRTVSPRAADDEDIRERRAHDTSHHAMFAGAKGGSTTSRRDLEDEQDL